jgi:hypothetical protein
MKPTKVLLLLAAIALAGSSTARAGQLTDDEQRSLRDRIQVHYDVVPLTDSPPRPKTRAKDVRLIEIPGRSIEINGATVTGELREHWRRRRRDPCGSIQANSALFQEV